jgi:hypothetical protein
MDYRALPWMIAYHGLRNIPKPSKPVTTAKRYGAGMAHTIASRGHASSKVYGLSQMIMDYHGLSWITKYYN